MIKKKECKEKLPIMKVFFLFILLTLFFFFRSQFYASVRLSATTFFILIHCKHYYVWNSS